MTNYFEACVAESVKVVETLNETQSFAKAIAVEERARGYFEACTSEEQERVAPEVERRLKALRIYVGPALRSPNALRLKAT